MKLFTNNGCGQCVLLEKAKGTMLIAAIDRDEYVVANEPLTPSGRWTGGEYYKSLDDAKDDYNTRTRR